MLIGEQITGLSGVTIGSLDNRAIFIDCRRGLKPTSVCVAIKGKHRQIQRLEQPERRKLGDNVAADLRASASNYQPIRLAKRPILSIASGR